MTCFLSIVDSFSVKPGGRRRSAHQGYVSNVSQKQGKRQTRHGSRRYGFGSKVSHVAFSDRFSFCNLFLRLETSELLIFDEQLPLIKADASLICITSCYIFLFILFIRIGQINVYFLTKFVTRLLSWISTFQVRRSPYQICQLSSGMCKTLMKTKFPF